MEEVVVAGRRFVAAKTAAKRVGYHPDYVGQLCRSGLVACEKVGKSWFVWEEGLARHKLVAHTKETPSSPQKKIVNRKDDFTPSRREIVAAIAERVRCYPAAGHHNTLKEAAPSLSKREDSSEFLPPLRAYRDANTAEAFVTKNLGVEEELNTQKRSGSLDALTQKEEGEMETGSVVSQGDAFVAQTGRQRVAGEALGPTARPSYKQLPPPPLPRPVSYETAEGYVPDIFSGRLPSESRINAENTKKWRTTKKDKRFFRKSLSSVIRYGVYAIITAALLLSVLSIRSVLVCHTITGCEKKYEIMFFK
ncbi:MAG: hypothetical protein KatS3mg099_329 [Candidatus Parcubacteria bacterium]|nr:MAG: hypothetical protein KatS3mg099_329 [Candidatus Parcubacteria bacterium]